MDKVEAGPAAGMDTDGAAWEARRLIRGARQAVLATATEGQPFAALVTPATAPDGSILLLLSGLSEHTRHLRRDGRCAVLFTGRAVDANPQTAPRVSVTGLAEPEPDPALKTRWLAIHPYGAQYAGFADFTLWRIRPLAGLFVGGFARAVRLKGAQLAPAPEAVAAVAAAEAGVIAHCNADHADALVAIANAAGLPGEGWRMATCDADGFDLVQETRVQRIDFPEPADGAGAIRKALVHLAGAARNALKSDAGRGGAGGL